MLERYQAKWYNNTKDNNYTTFKEKGKRNMEERIFDKDQYINEELKKVNVRREDFDRWVNILKEEYERENGR